MFKRIVGINLIQASGIDKAKHHIAKLCFSLRFVHVLHLSFELADLFFYFVPYLRTLFPIKPHVACLVLNAISLNKRGQSSRHTS